MEERKTHPSRTFTGTRVSAVIWSIKVMVKLAFRDILKLNLMSIHVAVPCLTCAKLSEGRSLSHLSRVWNLCKQMDLIS